MTPSILPRPPRPAEMQPYIDNEAMWATLFTLGGLPHAGDAETPRRMERVSLDDMRQRFEHHGGAIRKVVHGALHLIFWSERGRMPPEKGLRVPAEHLWWLASPGDTVLLSDGVTHHYTTIGRVDRDAETISFADYWPEDFFLQKDRNVLGIEAAGTIITRVEFGLVTTGILTWDTVRLIDSYFRNFPEQRDSIDQQLRAGHAIMNVGPDHFASYAIKHFIEAMRLADGAADESRALRAAACAWLAGVCSTAPAIAAGDKFAARLIEKMLELPLRRAPMDTLLHQLLPDELCRLANASGQVGGGMPLTEAATSVAIEKMPDCENAYWLRAMARVRTNPPASAQDARRALELNAPATAALEAEVERLGQAPVDGGMTRTRLAERRHRRVQELQVLVAACANYGDYRASRDAVLELCALTPNELDALHKRFVIEQVLGDADGIVVAAKALASRDLTPELRAAVDGVLAQGS